MDRRIEYSYLSAISANDDDYYRGNTFLLSPPCFSLRKIIVDIWCPEYALTPYHSSQYWLNGLPGICPIPLY